LSGEFFNYVEIEFISKSFKLLFLGFFMRFRELNDFK
jgi:hypothetical protein